jgi:dTDP-4-dehydrorhamnose 3,5-epimerase-like enzyme
VTYLDWSVECRDGCGTLAENVTAAEASRIAEKHTKQEQHTTSQTGVPRSDT